ncbi:helix-turn-helix domain-containing protein [Luteimonas sp. RIT-PG2_3]
MTLSARIRKSRVHKGFSQSELGNKLRVSRSAVANWECGDKAPSSVRLQQLALVAEVSYEWLATGRGSPELQDDWIPTLDADIVDDPEERVLLLAYRNSSGVNRRSILEFIASTSSSARQIISRARSSRQRSRTDRVLG